MKPNFKYGITSNGITSNGITSNGITSNGITSNGILVPSNGTNLTGKTSNKNLTSNILLQMKLECHLMPQFKWNYVKGL